ncbi:MAG TPA: bifunctional DNA-binding transcriptional regulator/O6-methylguanine-DNA methyltransferase Ada [Gemmatimonadales bacterium]|nr:bifunctional DNA-binding transcriptional regulator/O6-methylguanine-DNA methyltransferase Ada [Gemmatimonadales bacterium]
MPRAALVSDHTAERRWRIVLARDRRYDDAFVYAVRSTGIYCRPSCPSRRPGREQVAFFTAPAAAERAGFRACQRCRPAERGRSDARLPLVREVCRMIDAHPDAPAQLAALAAHVGATPHRVLRAFRTVLGVSPRQYRDARRVDRFKAGLRQRGRVSRALYEAGYGSPSRVYERAHAQLGMTPATYSRGAAGTRIAYTVVPCSLGRLLVATTEHGICRVSLGSDSAALETGLRAEFPAAELRSDGGPLARVVTQILKYLDGRLEHLDLPLDVRATAFQRHVWEALRKIPYGATRSYADIARAIGRPRATRAVARACATNPAALVIPCHRVVRADGALGGYRWGLERKRALLAAERAP